METGMSFQPGFYSGMLMRAIIINDQMQLPFRRGLGIDLFQKTDELLMTMPRHTITDDFAIQQIQGGEKRRCAIAFIVMCLPGWDSGTQGEQRLRPVECLNLTLLVNTQDKRMFRRIKIQPNNILKFLQKMLIPAQFERLH